MLKRSKPSPADSELLFEIDPEPATERLTFYGGAAVLIQTLRSLGVGQSVARHIQINLKTAVSSWLQLAAQCFRESCREENSEKQR